MLKVLDRRAAIAAQAHELENNLAENAYALEQKQTKVNWLYARTSLSFFTTLVCEYNA